MTYLGTGPVGIIIWRNHRRPPLVVLAPRRSHLRTVIGRLSTDQSQGQRSAPPEVPLAKLFRRRQNMLGAVELCDSVMQQSALSSKAGRIASS